MSLYLKCLLANRRAEQSDTLRLSRKASDQERLKLYTARRSAKRRAITEQLLADMAKRYWPWWCSLSECDKGRDWKLLEIQPIFRDGRELKDCTKIRLGAFLRLMGWTKIHIATGSIWRTPERQMPRDLDS